MSFRWLLILVLQPLEGKDELCLETQRVVNLSCLEIHRLAISVFVLLSLFLYFYLFIYF